MIEARTPTDGKLRSAWFLIPILNEELLGIDADSDDYRIIEKELPFANDVGEETRIDTVNDLCSMYEDLLRQQKISM